MADDKDVVKNLKGLLVGRSCVADPESRGVIARSVYLVTGPSETLEHSSSGTKATVELGVPIPQVPGMTVGVDAHYTGTEHHIVLAVEGHDRLSQLAAMRELLLSDGELTYEPAKHGTFIVVEEEMSKKAKDMGVQGALEWLSTKFKGGLSHFNARVASHIHNAAEVVYAVEGVHRTYVAQAIREHMLLKWEGALTRSEAMCMAMQGSNDEDAMKEYRAKLKRFVDNEKKHDAFKWVDGYWTFKKRISMMAAIRVLKNPGEVAQAICESRPWWKLFAKNQKKTEADELKKATDLIMVEIKMSPPPKTTATPAGTGPAETTTPTPAPGHEPAATPPAHAETATVLRGPMADQAFVGRTDLTSDIMDALTRESMVICDGNGGTGKSSVAKHVFGMYAEEPTFTHLVWANADTLGTFKASMADAAKHLPGYDEGALRTTEAKCAFAIAALQNEGVRCLLVLDNVDSEGVAGQMARNFLPAPSPCFRVLVTSRHGEEVKAKLCASAHIVPVKKLTADDAVAVASKLSDAEPEAVRDFVTRELMGLPLAIVHAAAYASRKGWDACKREYGALCTSYSIVDTSFDANVHPRGWDPADVEVLGRTIPMCFSLVKDTAAAGNDPLARATLMAIEQLFGTLAVLAPDDVPVSLLPSGWNTRGAVFGHEAVCDAVCDAVLRELVHLSLIRADERDGHVVSCHMHRLVQLVARGHADELPAVVDRACETIAAQWPAEDLKDIPYDEKKYELLARLLPHGVAIVQRAREYEMQSTAVARVARLCGLALDLGSGRLAESVDMWTSVLCMADAGVDGVDKLEAMSFLAEMRRLQADAADNDDLKKKYGCKGEEWITKIKAEVLTREAAGQTVMPIIYLNLGFAATGDEAIEYYNKVSTSDNKMFELRGTFNKAVEVRKFKKEPGKALDWAEKVLKAWSTDDAGAGGIGAHHPRTAEAMVCVAKCLLALRSDLARAEKLMRDAFASQRKMTGDVNGALMTQANLARVLVAQGSEEKLVEARQLVADGLEEAELWGAATAKAKKKFDEVKVEMGG